MNSTSVSSTNEHSRRFLRRADATIYSLSVRTSFTGNYLAALWTRIFSNSFRSPSSFV